VRRQLELSNEVAAALAGSEDAVLREIEAHVACDLFLRGNVVTLDGEQEAVDAAAEVIRELADLADQEDHEAELIEQYLPAELSDAELDALVQTALAETGAQSPRDMGKAIKHVMAAAGGRAEGRRVSTKVKEALN